MLSKAVLRQAFRTNLDRDDQNHAKFEIDSRALSERLADFLRAQSGVWAGFEPMGFEPDIRPAIGAAKHLRWAFPRVEHETTLGFYEVASRDALVKNRWGLWEPDPARAVRVDPGELHGLLVPGLAFDEKGNRLGRGRGYYDRALSGIHQQRCAAGGRDIAQPLKIGIALERQIAQQELPHDPHDVAMDLVVTESRTLKGTSR